MASKQDGAGFRTPEDVARRYMGGIKLTQEEIEEIKRAIVCDTALSITSTAPVQNKVITAAVNNKVTKETGKGLSQNDFTDSEKSKLDNMPVITQADVDRWNNGGGGSGWIPPIGYIWISTQSTDPGTLFSNTTWVRIKDTFLLAAGDTYAAGTTGGSATVTLSAANIPSHTHSGTTGGAGGHSHTIPSTYTAYLDGSGGTFTGGSGDPYGANTSYIDNHTHTFTTDGGSGLNGTAHDNMPPYKAVYTYERIM